MLQHHVSPGESLHVVGSLSELSKWDARESPAMKWTEGDNWVLDVEFPPGPFAFKVGVGAAV